MARIDHEVIRGRLERVLFEIAAIESKVPETSRAYCADGFEDQRYELEHRLYVALQALIDAATHIAVSEGADGLESARDAVIALRDLGIIDSELALRLASAVALRNVLAHEYAHIDDERVHRAMLETDDLGVASAAIWRWAEKRG